MDSLGDRIARSYVESKFPEGSPQDFLPHGCEDLIVTKESVLKELYGDQEATEEEIDLVNFIVEHAKKIFIISITSGLRARDLWKAMSYFKLKSLVDGNLPVVISKNEPGHLWFPSHLWPQLQVKAFVREQWKLLVPVFPERFVGRMELQPEIIFPFIHVDENSKSGTFGDVYQVTIHEAHQRNPMRKINGDLANAAIKELKVLTKKTDPMYKEWEAESKALEDTSGLGHPHVVQVKAIISKARRHYFMFQWADGGSLRDFYEKKPAPELDASLVGDIVQQLVGLAGAIHALHDYRGEGSYRHGDLKPENILVFGDNKDSIRTGTWKIADMGLARRHVAATRFRGKPTSMRYGTPSYEPPEVKTRPLEARSRLYDIWSMGCITLELVIWLLYGDETLVAFNNSMKSPSAQANPYWVINSENKAEIHPNVADIINRIKKDTERRGSTAIGDLLCLVETKLLIVPLPRDDRTLARAESADVHVDQGAGIELRLNRADSMQTGGPFRATAEEFLNALQEIQQKGKGNDTYLFTGRIRTENPQPSLQTQKLAPQSSAAPPRQTPGAKEQNLLPTPSSGAQVFGNLPLDQPIHVVTVRSRPLIESSKSYVAVLIEPHENSVCYKPADTEHFNVCSK